MGRTKQHIADEVKLHSKGASKFLTSIYRLTSYITKNKLEEVDGLDTIDLNKNRIEKYGNFIAKNFDALTGYNKNPEDSKSLQRKYERSKRVLNDMGILSELQEGIDELKIKGETKHVEMLEGHFKDIADNSGEYERYVALIDEFLLHVTGDIKIVLEEWADGWEMPLDNVEHLFAEQEDVEKSLEIIEKVKTYVENSFKEIKQCHLNFNSLKIKDRLKEAEKIHDKAKDHKDHYVHYHRALQEISDLLTKFNDNQISGLKGEIPSLASNVKRNLDFSFKEEISGEIEGIIQNIDRRIEIVEAVALVD